MIVEKKHLGEKMLLLITRVEEEKKTNKVLEKMRLPIYYQCWGNGTANSEILSLCGLQGTKRHITICVLPHGMVHETLRALSDQLLLERKGHGIAVTIPVTGMQDGIRKLLEAHGKDAISQKEGEEMEKMGEKESAFSMILVATNYGYSDDVVAAAKKGGAKGGTVLRGRRRGMEDVMQYLGVNLQEEQEFTLIVVPKAQKSAVMVEISRACGLNTAAHGIVLSLPVEEIMGIEQ